MYKAAEKLLKLARSENRTAFEVAATQLLAVLVRDQELQPLPDVEAQRHFAAGLARYKDGVETLARTNDESEVARAIRAINASNGELARMYESLDRTKRSAWRHEP
jgi:hypothetical protein